MSKWSVKFPGIVIFVGLIPKVFCPVLQNIDKCITSYCQGFSIDSNIVDHENNSLTTERIERKFTGTIKYVNLEMLSCWQNLA